MLASLLTLASVAVLSATAIVGLPLPVILAALTVFLGCFAFAAVEAYRASRRDGVSVPRAVGRMLKQGGKWLLEWSP